MIIKITEKNIRKIITEKKQKKWQKFGERRRNKIKKRFKELNSVRKKKY